jgi:hypothetical protein
VSCQGSSGLTGQCLQYDREAEANGGSCEALLENKPRPPTPAYASLQLPGAAAFRNLLVSALMNKDPCDEGAARVSGVS